MLRSVGALVSPRNIRVAPRGGAAVFRESTKNVRPFVFRPGRMTGRPATRQQRGASPRASPRDPRRGSEPCPSTRRRSTRTAIYRINNMPFRRRSTRGSRRLRGASARRSPSASRERVSTRDARRFTGRGARRDARRSSITGRLRETRRARNPCLRCELWEGPGCLGLQRASLLLSPFAPRVPWAGRHSRSSRNVLPIRRVRPGPGIRLVLSEFFRNLRKAPQPSKYPRSDCPAQVGSVSGTLTAIDRQSI